MSFRKEVPPEPAPESPALPGGEPALPVAAEDWFALATGDRAWILDWDDPEPAAENPCFPL